MGGKKGPKRPLLEFEILAHGLYRADQLEITYNPSLSMVTTPTIQAWMEAHWEEKLALARKKKSHSMIPLYFVS